MTKGQHNHMVCEDERHIFGFGKQAKRQNVFNESTGKYDDLQAICECGNAGFSLSSSYENNEEQVGQVIGFTLPDTTVPIKAVKSYTISADTLHDLLKAAGYQKKA